MNVKGRGCLSLMLAAPEEGRLQDMKTVFEHKPDLTFQEFAIEKTVSVPARKLGGNAG